VEVQALQNPTAAELHPMEVLVAVAVVIQEQEEQELQGKVMTVVLQLRQVMAEAAELVHQVEMEILQMELQLHVQVE
jgi:hypothetical protein